MRSLIKRLTYLYTLPDSRAGRLNEIGSVTIACVLGKLCRSDEINLASSNESVKKLSTTDCTEK